MCYTLDSKGQAKQSKAEQGQENDRCNYTSCRNRSYFTFGSVCVDWKNLQPRRPQPESANKASGKEGYSRK